MVEIANTTVLEYELNGLFWWWRYDIYIGGYTKIGTGVTLNVTVRTDEEGTYLHFAKFLMAICRSQFPNPVVCSEG